MHNFFNSDSDFQDTFDVLLGFDMETDIGSYTPYYEGVSYGTPYILEVLNKYKIRATFFWTGHAAENNKEMLNRVAAIGHETGCHGLFHETLGDPIFPLPNNWPILNNEVEGRLRTATDIVREASGNQPVSFRCPRLWGSTTVVNVLEKLGYVADASLPMYFYRNQLAPYHPSSTDWTATGDLKLVEIPNFCDMNIESNDPYQRDRDQWPLFRTKDAVYLLNKIKSFLQYMEPRVARPVICLYLHPWEFFPMPQEAIDFGECSVKPLPFIVKNCGPYAVEQLDTLCGRLKEMGGRFITAEQLAAEFETNQQQYSMSSKSIV